MTLVPLLWLVPVAPFLAFLGIIFFTNRSNRASHSLAVGAAAISWLLAMVIFIQAVARPDLGKNPVQSSIPWLPVGNTSLSIGVLLDPLTTVTLFFVAWTVLMIFIYSIGYHNFGQPQGRHDVPGLPPHGAVLKEKRHPVSVPSIEPMYARFFAFISLFAFAMFALVVTDNLLILYVAWEIMGLCSYLLIGFWYGKPSARDAAVKAFLTTRIGDIFLLIGMVSLYVLTGSLNYRAILTDTNLLSSLTQTVSPLPGLSWAGLIGLLLFAGTVGKSAQFPLHVWLPDAMEGPTPVSAMIHAATMVSAGIYLAARFFPLLSAGWVPGGPLTIPMLVMAAIGSFTALFAATIAVAQTDIKRVLAYSTISQLGYMVAALGIGAYSAAVFHLFTHAFFKALLFLGSGSVIHGMEHGALHSRETIDPQNMLNMGGLRVKMPVTFWTFVAGGLALSGFPLVTAGFWSKDAILAGAFNGGQALVFTVLALSALLTAFYTMRQITLTFLGKPRTQAAEHAVESQRVMTLPLVVLAFFAVMAGWIGISADFPGAGGLIPDWFAVFTGSGLAEQAEATGHSLIPLVTSLVVSLGGLYLGWQVYRGYVQNQADPLERPLGRVFTWMKRKFYLDELYSFIFVRPSLWLAETFTSVWVDKVILDGILHGLARLGWNLGRLLRMGFDLPVINGAGDGIGAGTRRLGAELKRVQTGRLQQYMLISITVVILAGVLFLFLMAQA
jgi:NADH-quinone oxidoreductase subunit L